MDECSGDSTVTAEPKFRVTDPFLCVHATPQGRLGVRGQRVSGVRPARGAAVSFMLEAEKETMQDTFGVDGAMRYESAAEFDELHEAFRQEHDAETPTRKHIAFNMMMGCWRGRRLARTEAGLFSSLTEEVCQTQKNFDRYNPPLKGTAREMREWQTGIMGRAFRRDAAETNSISKIVRAETAIDMLFYKALGEARGPKAPRKLKAA